MVGDLFAADADTASDCDDEPDERDAAATTVLTFGALTVRVVEAAGAFGGSGADQSGNVVWGAAAALAAELEGRDQGSKRERNSQLQRLISRPFSTRFG